MSFIGLSVNSLKYFNGPSSPAKSELVSTSNIFISKLLIESVTVSNLFERLSLLSMASSN